MAIAEILSNIYTFQKQSVWKRIIRCSEIHLQFINWSNYLLTETEVAITDCEDAELTEYSCSVLSLATSAALLPCPLSLSYLHFFSVPSYLSPPSPNLAIGGVEPFITSPPQDTSLPLHGSVNLTCTAEGDPEVTHRWFMDGWELEGERGSLLHLSGVDVEDRGCYSCSVENSLGVVMSPFAVLTIQSMYIFWVIGVLYIYYTAFCQTTCVPESYNLPITCVMLYHCRFVPIYF